LAKFEESLVPRPLTTVIIAIAIPAAIKPYSMAVAADSSARNLDHFHIVTVSQNSCDELLTEENLFSSIAGTRETVRPAGYILKSRYSHRRDGRHPTPAVANNGRNTPATCNSQGRQPRGLLQARELQLLPEVSIRLRASLIVPRKSPWPSGARYLKRWASAKRNLQLRGHYRSSSPTSA
jgi:hypothetical protein